MRESIYFTSNPKRSLWLHGFSILIYGKNVLASPAIILYVAIFICGWSTFCFDINQEYCLVFVVGAFLVL